METAATSRPGRGRAWLWGIGAVVVVIGAALATWQFAGRPSGDATAVGNPEDAAARPRLVSSHDYYLHVKLIELSERRPDGKTWDVGGSAPDIRFNLTWRHNIVWESTVKGDTLIGSWDLMKIDLRQVIASGGTADLESALNAPLIHYEPGATVKLTVWDDDTVDTDAAGSIILNLDALSPGDNSLAPTPGEDAGAIRRVVLTLIDRNTTVPQLIETMSNR